MQVPPLALSRGERWAPSLRSGFRLPAPTPARRLNFGLGRDDNAEPESLLARTLQAEQLLLERQAAAVAAQAAVGGDHPVAGDQDGHGVAVVGHAHCAEGAGTTHGAGDVGIGTRLA